MNVKQGDLAIVVNDKENPENNGIICHVNKFVGCVLYNDGTVQVDTWDCRSVGRPFTFKGDGYDMEGYFEDVELRAVSGLPEVDESVLELDGIL